MIDEKPTDGTSTSKKDQDGHGMMKCENFFRVPNPDDELNIFFVKMMNVDFFPTGFLGFRTHVEATTVCTTGSVRGLTCCTHIFLRTPRAQSHSHASHACAHTRMAQVHEKGVCRMSVFVLRLAFSFLMFHPALAVSAYHDITFPVQTLLPYLPVLKAQDMRNSAPALRSLAS